MAKDKVRCNACSRTIEPVALSAAVSFMGLWVMVGFTCPVCGSYHWYRVAVSDMEYTEVEDDG